MLSDDFWKQEQDVLESLLIIYLIAVATDSVDASTTLSTDIDPAVSQAAILDWVNAQAPKLAKEITANSKDAIEKAIEAGVPLDEQLDKIVGDSRAEIIAVTETTRSLAQGVIVAARESGGKGQVIWKTAEDELVDDEWCAPLEGEIRNVDESFGENVWGELMYAPPAHPFCRCQILPWAGD